LFLIGSQQQLIEGHEELIRAERQCLCCHAWQLRREGASLGLIFVGTVVMFDRWGKELDSYSDFDVFLQEIVRRQHESSTKKI
jgi:hypothetical protein